jgi:PAS domain S-box-containing protein
MKAQNQQKELDRVSRWHAEFIDNLPGGIYRTTVEGNFVFCNRGLAEIFGFDSAEDLIDFPVVDLYSDKKYRGDFIRTILKKGYVEDICLPFIKKDGTPIWCSITAKAVLDDDGIVVFIDGLIRDVTSELEGDAAKPGLDEMVESTDHMVVILDAGGMLLDINKGGAHMLGHSKDQLVGKPLKEFLIPRDKELLPLFLSDIMETGREECVFSVSGPKGKERQVELHAYLAKRGGRPHYIKGIGKDITIRPATHREGLSEDKFKGILEMAGGVSHRLNQPLTIINHLINEVLADSKADDNNHEKLGRIHQQVEKLNEIAKKIGSIKKYKAMEYVGGVRIFDIDNAS